MKSLWERCLAIILSMAIVSGLGGENFLAYAQEDISVQNEEEREEVTYTANETESDMDNDVFTFESSVNGTEDLVELSAGKSYYLQIMLDSELGGDARYTINFSNNSGSSFSVEKTDWGKNTTNINGLWIPFSIPDDAYGKYEVSVTVILANDYHAWDNEVINVGISSEGTCGDNLTWVLDSDGTLAISGMGEMYSYYEIALLNNVSWGENVQNIKSILIEGGVTSIGDNAFEDCSFVKSISLPNGITNIGNYAFMNCRSLTNIIIPDSVLNIGSDAFRNCTALLNIELPNSVISIGPNAFFSCSSIIEVVIPSSVSEVGASAFGRCKSLTNIMIPTSVTNIGWRVFYECNSLSDIYYGGTQAQWEMLDVINSSEIPDGQNVVVHYQSEMPDYKDISNCMIALSNNHFTYTGKAIEPNIIVTDSGSNLKHGTDYVITYSDNINAGEARISVGGIGRYDGMQVIPFTIEKASPTLKFALPHILKSVDDEPFINGLSIETDGQVTFSSDDTSVANVDVASGLISIQGEGSAIITASAVEGINYTSGTASYVLTVYPAETEKNIDDCTVSQSENRLYYDGTAKCPEITLSYDGMSLVLGTDYMIRYSNNINAGVATAQIEGIGQYTGTHSIEFTIYKATPTLRFASSNMTKTLGDTAFTNKLTVTTDGEVTYSSSNPSVATVNESSGLVTLKGAGTANITANAAEGQNYTSKSAAYKLTVEQPPTVDLSSLTYNFGNNYSVFGYSSSYRIPLSSYQIIFSGVTARELYSKNKRNWKGSCFGMSITSGIFNLKDGDMDVNDFNAAANKVSDLKVADINKNLNVTLRSWIEAMHVSWYDAGIQKCWSANVGISNLERMCEMVKTGVPIVVYLSGSGSAHAVVGYKVEKRSSRETYLYVYDPNFPKKTRYLTLGTDSKGNFLSWYYYMNDSEDWGSDYDGRISFITPDCYNGVWKSSPKTKQSEKPYGYMAASQGEQFESSSDDINMLVTNSDKFTIQDDEGNVVAKVQDGQLSSANTDIFQYQPLDYIDMDENILIYLPTDSYVIQNTDDSIGKLEIDMVNTNQRACVVTSADNITFHVDDRKEQNVVSIKADDGDSYEVMLDSSLENAKNMEEITVSGTAAKNTVEVGMTEDGCVLKNCTDIQMKINGQEPGNMAVSGQADISKAKASLEYASCDYDGKNKEPEVTIKFGSSILKNGTDYVVVYGNNIEPGTATATVYGIANYAGIISLDFTIKGKDSNAALTEAKNKAKRELNEYKKPGDYREAQKKELIKAIADGRNAIDFAKDEAGVKKALSDAKAVIDRIKTNAQLTEEEERAKNNISSCKVTLSKKSYIYDGRKKQPTVTVKAGKTKLIKNTDYTVSYKNNAKVGTASIIISGKGKYTGKITKTFKILPQGTSISGKITAKYRGFTMKWKKQKKSASGYQIQYSTSKKFTKKTTVTKTVKKNSTTKLTVKNLKAKKKYYVRIRTYKTVGGKKYYSSWSKCQKVETKK